MKIDDSCIFEILIYFYPNLVVKLAKISPKMIVKMTSSSAKIPSPVISRHNLKTPSPLIYVVYHFSAFGKVVYVFRKRASLFAFSIFFDGDFGIRSET